MKCPYCEKTYKTQVWLDKHIANKHQENQDDVSTDEVSTITKREPLFNREQWRITYSDGTVVEVPFTPKETLEFGVEITRSRKLANREKPRVGWFKKRRMKRRAKKYE